jgi:ketosteroid isomerase-like protein
MSEQPSQKVHDEVIGASRSGDLTRLLALFRDDAVVMPPNDTTLYGHEEIRWWWEDYFKFFEISSSVETEHELTVDGNQAFERSAFCVTIVPKAGGPTIMDDIRSLSVWKQEADGTWKISHRMWNSTKPVGAGTNRYMTRMIQKKKSCSSA